METTHKEQPVLKTSGGVEYRIDTEAIIAQHEILMLAHEAAELEKSFWAANDNRWYDGLTDEESCGRIAEFFSTAQFIKPCGQALVDIKVYEEEAYRQRSTGEQ